VKGLVFHGPGDIRCESVPDPSPKDARGAIVQVERSAICGSDLHLYHGAMPVEEGFTLGHEFVGRVVEVGSAVHSVRPGDPVMVSGVIGCGECPACQRGEVVRCARQQTRVFGVGQGLEGGQAEAVAVPVADHAIRRIPEGISAEQAVLLTDILPTGFLGAKMADIQPGDTLAVIGLGPVGLLAVMCAQLFGPAEILAIDSVPERLAVAEELGAHAVPADQADAVVMEQSGGQGVDAVIEAVGADATILKALQLARAGGNVSIIGVSNSAVAPFPMILPFMKDLTIRSSLVPVPALWPALVPLVAHGRLHPERVFTDHMALSEGALAYRRFDAREDGILKVLLDPSK